MITVPYLDQSRIERRALSHRRELGFSDEQAVDAMTLITKLKNRYPEFDYLRVDDRDLGVIEAQWDSTRKLIRIPERIFRGMNAGDFRSRNTVMHEVSHVLLGHKGVLNRAPVGNRGEALSSSIARMERQAKSYAACFLVPNTAANRVRSAKELSNRYGVSLQLAEIRLREIRRNKL